MMPDLRARIKAAATMPKEAPRPHPCQVLEARTPLARLCEERAILSPKRLGLAMPGFTAKKALFLDAETTGLHHGGSVAFLVGLGYVEGEDFVVRQLLMRDYPEEESLLCQLAEWMARYEVIVSFNGKSFDIPLLKDRFLMVRMRERWREMPHLDLLHAARRIYRLRLGSCNLGRLEQEVLGIHRDGDLPGSEVPERFFRYLKTGNYTLLEDVLRHNLQDIRTLWVLLHRLSACYEYPDAQAHIQDVFSAGKALDRQGEGALARRCFQVASTSALARNARLAIATSYRGEKAYREAAGAYEAIIRRGEGDLRAYTALAILLERYLLDVPGALTIAEQALLRFAGDPSVDGEAYQAMERRRVRLTKRMQRNKG